MARLLLVLAVLAPLAAGADAKKKPRADGVEIWPPPAPDTDQAGNPKPKPEEKKPPPEPPDAGGHFELDPELRGDPSPRPAAEPDDEKPDDTEDDACAEAYDDCKEDCTIQHATDDTLHVPKGKKLPVAKCLGRCQAKRETCEEAQEAGFKGKNDD